MTRIGVNLTWLVPGVVGGSEEYSIRLLESLVDELPVDVTVRLYGRADLFSTYPTLADRFDVVEMPTEPASKARRVAMEQTWLSDISRHDRVVHHMGGTMPLRPAPSGQRRVVTIHDLQPLDLAANFGRVKRLWLGRVIPRAARAADMIVCPSRFTAERIVDLLDVEPERVRVVHHGFEVPGGTSSGDSRGTTVLDRRRPGPTELRLTGQTFLLYPAIAYRHKRHRDAVEALALARERSVATELNRVHLVLTGRRGPESNDLDRLIQARGLDDRVHVLGRVPEHELDWLYRHAAALVFPSEYEGFGNPCLEAMSRGCPVIAASAGSLPEVVGDAGLLYPVGDVPALVDRITPLLTEPDTVAAMVANGFEQARLFTPKSAAERLWSVYREQLSAAANGELHARP